MILNFETCVPCKHRRNILKQQLDRLRIIVKTKAINEGRTYAIWMDSEDTKLRHAPYSDFDGDSPAGVEIVSQYP